jgi:hypothetical protein
MRVLILSLALVLFSLCASAQSVDAPRLMGVSVKEAEAVLGKPKQVNKIKSFPEQMPGEFRTYPRGSDDYAVLARYYRGVVVSLTIRLPRPTADPEEALRFAGVRLADLPAPSAAAPFGLVWHGDLLGRRYEEIALRASERGVWDTVQLKVPQPGR